MKSVNQHHFSRFKFNGYKLASVCLLILLVAISSCAVRKGLQYLLQGEATSATLNVKPGKTTRSTNPNITVWNITCSQMDEAKSRLISTLDAQQTATTNILLYFTLIPAFLISVFLLYKDHNHLPVPYATLNWPQLPLFLQNRLLLI